MTTCEIYRELLELQEKVLMKNQNPAWILAGIKILPENIHFETIDEVRSGIKKHSMVVEFLVRHSNDPDFEEKYFRRPNEVRYYEVLELAEKEAA